MTNIYLLKEKYPYFYKSDSKGQIRIWTIERDNNKYRVKYGIKNKKITVSKWTECFGKNKGKINETSNIEQAIKEIDSKINLQLKSGYFRNESDIKQSKKFNPMLAQTYGKVQFEFPVYSSPKLDGIRCIINKNGMYTRSGNRIISAPHIWKVLSDLFLYIDSELIFDGELYNHELKDDFNKIISLVRKTKPTPDDLNESLQKIKFYCFDIYSSNKNYKERFINKSLDFLPYYHSWNKFIHFLGSDKVDNQEELDNLFFKYLKEGYEGQMIRHGNYPYENKRSKSLLKRKTILEEEFKIYSIESGKGNWNNIAKKVNIILNSGDIQGAGIKGSQKYLINLLNNKFLYEGGTATVMYQNKTPDGKLRFPVVKAVFEDNRNV